MASHAVHDGAPGHGHAKDESTPSSDPSGTNQDMQVWKQSTPKSSERARLYVWELNPEFVDSWNPLRKVGAHLLARLTALALCQWPDASSLFCGPGRRSQHERPYVSTCSAHFLFETGGHTANRKPPRHTTHQDLSVRSPAEGPTNERACPRTQNGAAAARSADTTPPKFRNECHVGRATKPIMVVSSGACRLLAGFAPAKRW